MVNKAYNMKDAVEQINRDSVWIDGCLLYQNRPSVKSPRIRYDDKRETINRVVWQYHMGSIPNGYRVYRTCKQQRCVNIEHLELLTRQQGGVKSKPKQDMCSIHNRPYDSQDYRGWNLCNLCRANAAAAWRERNPEAVIEYRRYYIDSGMSKEAHNKRLQNPAQLLKYRLKNREYARLKRLRAIEDVDYDLIVKRDRSICHICEGNVSLSNMHIDHIIPLIFGGYHTYNNLKVAHAFCNIRKGHHLNWRDWTWVQINDF